MVSYFGGPSARICLHLRDMSYTWAHWYNLYIHWHVHGVLLCPVLLWLVLEFGILFGFVGLQVCYRPLICSQYMLPTIDPNQTPKATWPPNPNSMVYHMFSTVYYISWCYAHIYNIECMTIQYTIHTQHMSYYWLLDTVSYHALFTSTVQTPIPTQMPGMSICLFMV